MSRSEKIYYLAKSFYNSGCTRPKNMPKSLVGYVAHYTNLAFSVELGLKCLILILTGKLERNDHSIKNLFNKIPNQDNLGRYPKKIIQEYWAQRVKEINKMELVYSSSSIYENAHRSEFTNEQKKKHLEELLDFDRFLNESHKYYTKWRYIYDYDQFPEAGQMPELFEAVRHYLLMIKPELKEHE